MLDEPTSGFFLDDGSEIDPDLIAKPALCESCWKDDDPSEEILCTLTRIDQRGKKEFECHVYELKW